MPNRRAPGARLDFGMETYLTEMVSNNRYSVKVVRHDGKVLASAKFPTMGLAHQWIDERQKQANSIVGSLDVEFTRQ